MGIPLKQIGKLLDRKPPDVLSVLFAKRKGLKAETARARPCDRREARAKVEERKALWSPELQARVSQPWEELTREIQSATAAGETPGRRSVN
ncbi:MAG: hypothetical protein JWO80_5909 [Bryobacterales bacterium]|nr:hypothetical protein [Bryobacterales bacterium]